MQFAVLGRYETEAQLKRLIFTKYMYECMCILDQIFKVYACSRWYVLPLFCYECVKSQININSYKHGL